MLNTERVLKVDDSLHQALLFLCAAHGLDHVDVVHDNRPVRFVTTFEIKRALLDTSQNCRVDRVQRLLGSYPSNI